MLIKDIKPIGKVGRDLINTDNADDIIDKIIELPLRKACKIFKNKKIETNMSSANKNNLPKKGKRVEKEDIKKDDKFHYLFPNLLSVGKGSAWIMINYDKLSNENKDRIFELEKEYGEKHVWFVYSMYYVKYHSEENEYNDYKKKFDDNSFRIMYHNRYPRRAIFVRKQLNDDTTVEEVEKFFCEFAEKMLQQ